MGSVGSSKAIVARKDLSSLTKSQREVMEKAYEDTEFARTHTVDEWAMKAVTRYYTNIDDAIEDKENHYPLIKRWADYMYESKQDAINSLMEDVNKYKDKYGSSYQKRRDGIVLTRTSSNTLRALEKRGFIKIIRDAKTGVDTIKIIEDEKRR